jgi:hypothetical protein
VYTGGSPLPDAHKPSLRNASNNKNIIPREGIFLNGLFCGEGIPVRGPKGLPLRAAGVSPAFFFFFFFFFFCCFFLLFLRKQGQKRKRRNIEGTPLGPLTGMPSRRKGGTSSPRGTRPES